MKKIKLLVILIVVVAACALVAWLPKAGEKCTGGIYTDHPGLQAECLHQQTITHDEPYPGPGEPEPYPGPYPYPAPVIQPTPVQEPTPTSAPMHRAIDDLKP